MHHIAADAMHAAASRVSLWYVYRIPSLLSNQISKIIGARFDLDTLLQTFKIQATFPPHGRIINTANHIQMPLVGLPQEY